LSRRRASSQSRECEDQPERKTHFFQSFSIVIILELFKKGFTFSSFSSYLLKINSNPIKGLEIDLQRNIAIRETSSYLLTGNYQPEIFEGD
jgi:hypothetical protein